MNKTKVNVNNFVTINQTYITISTCYLKQASYITCFVKFFVGKHIIFIFLKLKLNFGFYNKYKMV